MLRRRLLSKQDAFADVPRVLLFPSPTLPSLALACVLNKQPGVCVHVSVAFFSAVWSCRRPRAGLAAACIVM